MKFKVLSRSEEAHTRERRDDVQKVSRNANPELHPFERAREYQRALNAAKLGKMFAKPLVGQLEGHMDGIWSMCVSPKSLVAFVSGAADGEIRVWDLPHKKCLWSTPAHRGIVKGVSVVHDGVTFLSCGEDKTIKHWSLNVDAAVSKAARRQIEKRMLAAGKRKASKTENDQDEDDEDEQRDEEEEEEESSEDEEDEEMGAALEERLVTPLTTYSCAYGLSGVDCHWDEYKFVSCGSKVDVWDQTRMDPIATFAWGADSVSSVKFNPAERNLIGATAADRSIVLYDIRQSTPLRKVVLNMKSNAFAWNPMEPLNFTVANEDHNLYSFDMRKLQKASMVHKDHVGAVMDVSYSPTGREFCTASYDRTIRIFKSLSPRSHQVYHSQRMQRVFCSVFSHDAKFVMSGSDDTNIRIWKAEASKSLGRMLPREQTKVNYSAKLVDRFQHVRELNRITRHQLTPKEIKKEAEKKRIMRDAERRRTQRRIDSRDPNAPKPKADRERSIVKELE